MNLSHPLHENTIMDKIVRTAYGAELIQRQLRKIPFLARPNTTLNQKLGILKEAAVPTGEYPVVNYLAIGNQGHTFEMDGSGVATLLNKQHLATHAAPFGMTPFVLRPVTDDLAPAQRERYALRKEIQVGQQWYAAYYLRRLDPSSNDVLAEYRKTVDGVTTSRPFVPDASSLDPVPSTINFDDANVVLGESISYVTETPFIMTSDDVQEYLSACNLLYGSENKAIISDMAICSGYDYSTTVSSVNGGSFQFTESICTQVFTFMSCFHALAYNRLGLTTTLGLVSDSPLFMIDAT